MSKFIASVLLLCALVPAAEAKKKAHRGPIRKTAIVAAHTTGHVVGFAARQLKKLW